MRCGFFFCPEFGFGRPGERDLMSSRLNLNKMLFSVTAYLRCLLGATKILSLVVELALF